MRCATAIAVTAWTMPILLCSGCPDWASDANRPVISLEDVTDDSVFYVYADAPYAEGELRRLDLATGEKTRLVLPPGASTSYLTVQGDWYVAHLIGRKGKPVSMEAVHIPTGQRVVIYESQSGVWWPDSYRLRNGKVALLAGASLDVFDLATEEVVHQILLPEPASSIDAWSEDLMLMVIAYGDASRNDFAFIDLATEEVTPIPKPGGNWEYSPDESIHRDSLVRSGTERLSATRRRLAVLCLDAETETWREVVDYGQYEERLSGSSYSLIGLSGQDGTRVAVEYQRVEGFRTVEHRVELLDLASGTRRILAASTPGPFALHNMTGVIMRNGRVYWIDPARSALFIHNLEGGSEEYVDFD